MSNENSAGNKNSVNNESNDSLKGVSVYTHNFAVSHLLSPALKGNDFNYNYNSTDYSLRAIVDIVCKQLTEVSGEEFYVYSIFGNDVYKRVKIVSRGEDSTVVVISARLKFNKK